MTDTTPTPAEATFNVASSKSGHPDEQHRAMQAALSTPSGAQERAKEWIDSLRWSDEATPELRAIVATNIREFASFLDEFSPAQPQDERAALVAGIIRKAWNGSMATAEECAVAVLRALSTRAEGSEPLASCDLCGEKRVQIRGPYPGTEPRIVCPTCNADRLAMIHAHSAPSYDTRSAQGEAKP